MPGSRRNGSRRNPSMTNRFTSMFTSSKFSRSGLNNHKVNTRRRNRSMVGTVKQRSRYGSVLMSVHGARTKSRRRP